MLELFEFSLRACHHAFLFADLLRGGKVNTCKSFHVKRQIAHASTS